MKKNTFVLIVASALIAAVWSGVGAFASSGQEQSSASLNGRVRALEGKVRVLNSQLKSVKKKVTTVEGLQRCLRASGISKYGTPPTTGYVHSIDGGNSFFLTTALDFDTGAAPHIWAASIDASCVTPSSALGAFQIRKMSTLSQKSLR